MADGGGFLFFMLLDTANPVLITLALAWWCNSLAYQLGAVLGGGWIPSLRWRSSM